jgi:hypothetical protein
MRIVQCFHLKEEPCSHASAPLRGGSDRGMCRRGETEVVDRADTTCAGGYSRRWLPARCSVRDALRPYLCESNINRRWTKWRESLTRSQKGSAVISESCCTCPLPLHWPVAPLHGRNLSKSCLPRRVSGPSCACSSPCWSPPCPNASQRSSYAPPVQPRRRRVFAAGRCG